jgi:two-component system sensor histidine kinase RpfC
LYDESVLLELSKLGDSDFLQGLISNFQSDGKTHIERIKAAIEDDYLEYREALHALKGSSIELGANMLADICQQGEQLKPYELGSKSIKKIAAEIEAIFLDTSAALSNATRQNAVRS